MLIPSVIIIRYLNLLFLKEAYLINRFEKFLIEFKSRFLLYFYKTS